MLRRLGATNIDAIAKFITKFKHQERASGDTCTRTERRGGISAVFSPRRNGRALLSVNPKWSVESDGYSELVVLTAVHQIITDFGGKRPGLKKLRVRLAAVGVRVSEKRLRKILNDQNNNHGTTEKAITSGKKSQGKSVGVSVSSRRASSTRNSSGTAVLRLNIDRTVTGVGGSGVTSSQKPQDRSDLAIPGAARVRETPRRRLGVAAVDLKRDDKKHHLRRKHIYSKTGRTRGEHVGLVTPHRQYEQNGPDDGISLGTLVANGIHRKDEKLTHKTKRGQKVSAPLQQVGDRNDIAESSSENHEDLTTTDLTWPLAGHQRSNDLCASPFQDVLRDSSKQKFYPNNRQDSVPILQSANKLSFAQMIRADTSEHHQPVNSASIDDHTEHFKGPDLLRKEVGAETKSSPEDFAAKQRNDPTHSGERKRMRELALQAPAGVQLSASCVDVRDNVAKGKYTLALTNEKTQSSKALTLERGLTMDKIASTDPVSDETNLQKPQCIVHCDLPQHNACKNSQTPKTTSTSVADGDGDLQSTASSKSLEPKPEFDVLKAVDQITRDAGGTRPGFKKLRTLLLAKGIRVSEKRLRKWLKHGC